MDSAAVSPIETCPNCSASLLGSHCHECGQKKIDADEYSLKRFIGRTINDFTDLESNKIFRTLSALVVGPGLLAAEYLAGRRGRYPGPLKLYLTFSALYGRGMPRDTLCRVAANFRQYAQDEEVLRRTPRVFVVLLFV